MRVHTDVVLNQDVTGTVTVPSTKIISLEHIYGFSCQVVSTVTSAVSGMVVKWQVTNDDAMDANITPNWTDLDSGQTVVASGTTIFNYDAKYFRYARFVVVLSSGTVTVVATSHTKGM